MSPDGKLPKGALLEARPTIEFASRQYEVVRGLDAQNEKRPRKWWIVAVGAEWEMQENRRVENSLMQSQTKDR